MKDNHSSMTNKYLTKQTKLLGTVQVSKKKEACVYPNRKWLTRILKRG